MTKLQQIINVSTLEQALEFLMDYDRGIVLEELDVCTGCKDLTDRYTCYNKNTCVRKMIEKYLIQK